MPRRSPQKILVLAVVALCLPVVGCSSLIPDVEALQTPNEPSSTATPKASDPAPTTSGDDFAAAIAEREEFFAEQQLPRDGSPLVATTKPQRDFIGEQRAYLESQGGVWSAQIESIYLALAADACETSILNFHRLSTATAQLHINSSPLYQMLLTDLEGEARVTGERNLADVMVFGTRFLCPLDAPQWEEAFGQLYE